jgi:hypothetical protein
VSDRKDRAVKAARVVAAWAVKNKAAAATRLEKLTARQQKTALRV